jgi:hypothetical protein
MGKLLLSCWEVSLFYVPPTYAPNSNSAREMKLFNTTEPPSLLARTHAHIHTPLFVSCQLVHTSRSIRLFLCEKNWKCTRWWRLIWKLILRSLLFSDRVLSIYVCVCVRARVRVCALVDACMTSRLMSIWVSGGVAFFSINDIAIRSRSVDWCSGRFAVAEGACDTHK